MINTLFFDLGGVLIKQPNGRQLKIWKKVFGGKHKSEVLEMLENPHGSQLIKDICLGNLTEDFLWHQMAEKWHISPMIIQYFRRKMSSQRQLNSAIIDFIAKLRGKYKTAILSNAGDQTRRLMEETYHLNVLVDEIIISAEEGVIKPDHRIFEIAMVRLETKPEQSLLLDDYLENVVAAREFGMHAVQFINTHQAINEVCNYLDGRCF